MQTGLERVLIATAGFVLGALTDTGYRRYGRRLLLELLGISELA